MPGKSKVKYRVWWVPQTPGKAFTVKVRSVKEGIGLCKILGNYDKFQLKHNIRSDFTSTGGVQYRIEGDLEGWEDWPTDAESENRLLRVLKARFR